MAADQLKSDHLRLTRQIDVAEKQSHMLAAKDGALGVLNDLAVELKGPVVAAGKPQDSVGR